MYVEDTIAAIATPPGSGGIGIIRVSGPAAESIATEVFRRTPDGPWQTHRLYHGRIVEQNGSFLDEALAVLMRAPSSYTGEDVLELHCHGSPVILRLALQSILRLGARPAGPGEFTKRAFINSKLDLTQAEAVIDLVRARTPESASQAADQLFGGLSRSLAALRHQLIRVKAHLEACIDFGDEDLNVDEAATADSLAEAVRQIDALLSSYARGRLLRHGLQVAITGRPNVGKSSLLNALLGEDRAIVTPTPGTTRDVIEESADFGGVPVVLRDMAGLRDAAGEVERIGVERARRVVEEADVVMLVLDASLPPESPAEYVDDERAIIALNKIDLPCAWAETDIAALEARYRVARVSAKEHLGLDGLRHTVIERTGTRARDAAPTLTSSRQHDALFKVRESLCHALDAVRDTLPPDLVAVDVQAALDHIGSVTGQVTSEDVLDTIFREFCIGK